MKVLFQLSDVLPCRCGLKPLLQTGRVSEDAEAVWLECSCGEASEHIEDAYVFDAMLLDAMASWNEKQRKAGGSI